MYKLVIASDEFKVKFLKKYMRKLYNLGFGPSLLTTLGFVSGIIANLFLWKSRLLFVFFFILYFLLDYLDGALAKSCDAKTIWGDRYDFLVDITLAFVTLINVGLIAEHIVLGILSVALLFYQEWFYLLLRSLNINRLPIHSYYIAYPFIFFGYYSIGLYSSILLSTLGSFICLFFFIRSKNN